MPVPTSPRPRRRPRKLLALLLLPLLPLAAGCERAPADGRFDAQPATPSPSCLVHQAEPPGTRYRDTASSDGPAVLEMMRYYTANGAKPYCDGHPPTAVDQQWTRLYTELGGGPGHVAG
ncbi:hypothetical protein OG455_40105 [Kitasatospora sp. NBC_01287]|uniref:hypothetical protein n=1 Tax=Kitasatospora sp. NBC_01287 TaxID=2903573 RepID=UPI002257A384|nr:hypothetical protein [Kitasatospora sp. NBC_01287]MCX4751640.1 hypothetical protein [Kitasatospora sp. NBC_01287]